LYGTKEEQDRVAEVDVDIPSPCRIGIDTADRRDDSEGSDETGRVSLTPGSWPSEKWFSMAGWTS